MYASSKQQALQQARALWALSPVFLDTETTGLDNWSEIIEISVVDAYGEVVVDSLVKPSRRIPKDVIRIHGITDDMVCNAPTWKEIWPFIHEALVGKQIGIYNADFDLRMMRQSHQKYGMKWELPERNFFCVMKMYAESCCYGRWQKLEVAGYQCGIGLPNAHRARADALLARAVFQYMVERNAPIRG